MIQIIISGCNGRMGQVIASQISALPQMEVVAGLDVADNQRNEFPVYCRFDDIKEKADVLVDFSHVSLTPSLLDYCAEKKLPLVLCTTGIAGDLMDKVHETAKVIPLFQSFNMSLGVSLLQALVRQAAKVLGDSYNIEIIEKHHNTKVDAPSGTAIMIAEAAASVLPYQPVHVFDRTNEHRLRSREEIGIHSIRGGTIVGEHEAMFIGQNEILTISHSAQSRDLFANGAIKAVEFLAQATEAKVYHMDDLIQWLS